MKKNRIERASRGLGKSLIVPLYVFRGKGRNTVAVTCNDTRYEFRQTLPPGRMKTELGRALRELVENDGEKSN